MRYKYQKVDAKITEYVRTVLVLEEGSDSESSDLSLVTNGMPALLCRTKNDNCQITLFGQSVPNEAWTIKTIQPIFKAQDKPLLHFSLSRLLWVQFSSYRHKS